MDQSVKPILSFQTFGCKVNTYDTGLLQSRLHISEPVERPVHVLNSCAVTAEASKEVVRVARRLKREQPESVVVVTGCSAQVDTDSLAQSGDIDLIVANSHKGQLGEILNDYLKNAGVERVHKSNIFKLEDLGEGGGLEESHTRSFLKIQDGCNSFCTFCVIPFARGKSRSLEPKDLAERIQTLQASGIKEVVLTGVHIGDYLSKNGMGLADLVEYILEHTTIERVRLSSLEPVELSQKLMSLFNDPRLCRHFHMSIQSACTKVLADMKRHYTAEQVSEALGMIHTLLPDAFVGMDVIAGFPGESEEEFNETKNRLAELPWTRLHVFPYSPRPLTFADRRTDQLRREVILERAQKLRALGDERYREHAVRQVGSVKKAVVLRGKAGFEAFSRDNWTIALDQAAPVGEEVAVKILGYAFGTKEIRLRGALEPRGDC